LIRPGSSWTWLTSVEKAGEDALWWVDALARLTVVLTIAANVKTMAAMTRKSIQVSESLLWRLAMVRVLFVELSTIASQCASEKVYGATLAPIPDLSDFARRRWMGRN
jgi:hypothetical protein